MKLKRLTQDFSVCKIEDLNDVDVTDKYFFLGKTDEELSLVCTTEKVPKQTIACDSGWKAFRIEGILDFSLTGILSKISLILAEHDIGIFAVSTYNTDYILTKAESFDYALCVLGQHGYEIAD